jgi:hypothetical protein
MSAPSWLKPAFWGMVLGAVGIMIVGFSWWGWTLNSTAEHMARQRTEAAVTAVLAPICVENFMAQADAVAKLAEFRKSGAWQQNQFIEKGGWATLSGSTTPNAAVAKACAETLVKTKL